MVDGLTLTISGEELRRLFEQGVVEHHRRAKWWKREERNTKSARALDFISNDSHSKRASWR